MAPPQKLHNPLDESGGGEKVKQKSFGDIEMETMLRAAGSENKSSSGIMAPQKDDIWKEIMKQYNAITSSQRAVEES